MHRFKGVGRNQLGALSTRKRGQVIKRDFPGAFFPSWKSGSKTNDIERTSQPVTSTNDKEPGRRRWKSVRSQRKVVENQKKE